MENSWCGSVRAGGYVEGGRYCLCMYTYRFYIIVFISCEIILYFVILLYHLIQRYIISFHVIYIYISCYIRVYRNMSQCINILQTTPQVLVYYITPCNVMQSALNNIS